MQTAKSVEIMVRVSPVRQFRTQSRKGQEGARGFDYNLSVDA